MDPSALREARVERGFKQKAFAAQLGVTAAFLSRVETGVATPTRDLLKRYAVALGMPEDTFLDESDYKILNGLLGTIQRGAASYLAYDQREESPEDLLAMYPPSKFNDRHVIQAVLTAAGRFLEHKAKNESKDTEPPVIFFTSSDNRLFHLSDRFEIATAVFDAIIRTGTSVLHVSRVTRQHQQDSNGPLFNSALALSLRYASDAPPRYQFCTIETAQKMMFPRDLFVFGSIGSVSAFATKSEYICDEAFFSEEPAIAAYANHLYQRSREAIHVFAPNDEESFHEVMARGRQGEYMMVQKGFSSITRPTTDFHPDTAWWKSEVAALKSVERVGRIAALRRLRACNVREELASDGTNAAGFRQICSRKYIASWADPGKLQKEEKIDRRNRLANIVGMLKQFDKLEFALTDKQDVFRKDVAWACTGDDNLVLEVAASSTKDNSPNELRANVRHRDMRSAFASVFDDTWSALPAAERDKRKVIEYLEALRESLR